MVSWKHILIAVVAIFVTLLLAVLAILGWWSATYNDLINTEQRVQEGHARYNGTLDLTAEKIDALWQVYDRYLSHESEVFREATKERAQYYKSVREGNVSGTVESALAFQVQALQIKEAFPQIVSEHLSEQTQAEFSSAINELKTSFEDWMYQTRIYNSKRNSFYTGIVGNYHNFPKQYPYYETQRTKLNISEILNK